MNMQAQQAYRERFRQAEIAADWLVKLETVGPGCHAAFAAWLKESPLHVREFLAITGLSKKLQGMDPQRSIDVETLIAAAGGNVVAWQESSPDVSAARDNKPSGRRMMGIAATIAVVALGGWWLTADLAATTYATSTGEQRSVKLADGSVIVLNTRSRLDVRFSASRREVRLLEGEALFVVEGDAARPFRVIADGATIEAIGTQFNVRRKPEGTVVSVVEGRVQVSGAKLDAGEKADIGPDGRVVKRAMIDTTAAIAWRQRRLVFHDNTLAEVAAEFNRYNQLQIRVESEAVRNKLLTGAFSADNPQGLILFLQKDEALAIESGPDAVLIRPR